MSKISELRLHARNRKLPSVMHLSDITPELLLHNLFIYEDLSKDPANLSGMKTAEERHDNAVAGVSTGKDVYDLGEFYNQIHTDEIDLSYPNLKIYNKRFAMLEPGHSIEYHMDPPNIFNLICPLTDPVILEVREDTSHFYPCEPGEIWFINPSYSHASHHTSKETRVAILANFEYTEESYEYLTRLL